MQLAAPACGAADGSPGRSAPPLLVQARSPAMAAPAADPGALAKQCKELQRKLDEALRERDDLVRDLESFCLNDGGTTFNSSSVLQERIYSTGTAQRPAWESSCHNWVLGAGVLPIPCCCSRAAEPAVCAAAPLAQPTSHPTAPLSTEKELAQNRAALAATTAERDNLREDLAAVKEAKRRAEQGFKAQLDRATALDKELAFYQVGANCAAVWAGLDV